MAALWTYPWTLTNEGLDETCEAVAERGIDALTVSSHYHSVRSMQPRTPDALFRQFSGGCHFAPETDRFERTAIDPPVVDVDDFGDPLGEVVDVAHDHGLSVNAWTVCLHNTRLGATNPAYRIESAFGDAHDHSLCPSHREVREYFAAVVDAAVARSVEEIHLESIGFPSAFHGHGREFGHDKRQVLTSQGERTLLSQCFCDGCRAAADSHSVDLDRARERVRSLLDASLADPRTDPPSLDALVRDDETIRELFDFRAFVVETFLERLADAAGRTPLNYYVAESLGGVEPGAGWPAGVRLGRFNTFLDRATAMCYVSDPDVALDRVRTLRRTADCRVDAGVTLDPNVVETESDLRALVGPLEDAVDGRVSYYHHGLMADAQLDWVTAAIGP